MKKQISILLILLFATTFLSANNVTITNITQASANQVSFTLSWENSWMVGGAPGNHDAVWVFIKYRPCGQSGAYTHALLSTAPGVHILSAAIAEATPVSLKDRFGNIPAGATETNGLGNNTGIMIRRSDVAKGNINGATCTLTIVSENAGVPCDPFQTGVDYEIKVIGIEMVYVGEESYTLGDLTIYNNSFIMNSVDNEDEIAANTLSAAHAAIPADYPKGYKSFYCMKYEITEGQFYKFMTSGGNLIGSPTDYFGNNRNNLSMDGTDTPDRAQNYMSWGALLAYLDWAALRPMTELEYEKSCKGSGTFGAQGYAWGGTTFIRALYLNKDEDGTEAVATLNANAHTYEPSTARYGWSGAGIPPQGYRSSDPGGSGYNFSAISAPECESVSPVYPSVNGDLSMYWTPIYTCGSALSYGYGPLGVGIFARDATVSRTTTGATYYGIMEMSGNVAEQCVDITSTTYTGNWGNGYLSGGGADVVGWPLSSDPRCLRGGGYSLPATNMRVCDRQYNNSTATADWGPNANAWQKGVIGGRGVR